MLNTPDVMPFGCLAYYDNVRNFALVICSKLAVYGLTLLFCLSASV